MKKRNRWVILTLVVIALTIGSISMIVIAAPTPPWEASSADPGETTQDTQPEEVDNTPDGNGFTDTGQSPVPQDDSSIASGEQRSSRAENNANREPLPDEDGYVGEIPTNTQDVAEPSASSDIPSQPDWDSFYAEPQPDDNQDGASVTPADTRWSTLFYYVHVAGSALRPRDSSVEWATTGNGGCVYNDGGSAWVILNIHLDIPDGVRIDYLRIYYHDTSASNSTAWVTSYDDEGGFTDVVNVYSSGDTGYGTMLSAEIAHVVSLDNDSYVLNWRPVVTGSGMALCGLRVAYRLPD